QPRPAYERIKPLGGREVDAARQLARGEALNAPDKINDCKRDVPAILQTPIPVDKNDVMATIIKDGYHTVDEVYKNVPPDQREKATAEGSRQKAAGSSLVAAFSLLCSILLFV